MKVSIEITLPGELKNEPIIYYLGHNFKIIPNIIEASFSTETGWASLVLEGEEAEIKKALEYLKSKRITVNILQIFSGKEAVFLSVIGLKLFLKVIREEEKNERCFGYAGLVDCDSDSGPAAIGIFAMVNHIPDNNYSQA